MNFSEKKINGIAVRIVEFLMKQDEGFNSTVCQLAVKMGYPDMEIHDLFELNNQVFMLASEKGLNLDMSEHDGKEEGLPFNLDFALKKNS